MAWREPGLSRPERIARRFGARVDSYEENARLQALCAERLAGFIRGTGGLPSGPVAEIGCGTGLLTRLMADGGHPWMATDIAPQMLTRCRERLAGTPLLSFRLMDGQAASFVDTPAAIVSNLAAQWFDDPAAGLYRLARHTRTLVFAVPLAGSFKEWDAAFRDLGRASGLLALPRPDALLDTLAVIPGARLRHVIETHELHYESGRAFADSFRRTGADQPRAEYRPTPIRDVLRRFADGMDVSVRVLYCRVDREE
jgi:malonyl-CoA O-methyltransferase